MIFRLTVAFALVLGCSLASLSGQQTSLQTLYFLNPLGWNPAAAGSEDAVVLTGAIRQQWVGLSGAPSTQWLNGHLPLYYLRSGVGLQVFNDRQGALRRTDISGAWSYSIVSNKTTQFRAGLGVGFVQASVDGSVLRAPDGQYEGGSFTHNDGVIPLTKMSAGAPDFSAGLFFRYKQLQMGASATSIFQPGLLLTADNTLRYQFIRNFHFSASYQLRVGEAIVLQPSVFFRTDLIKMQAEATILGTFKNNIFAGVSFRGYNARTVDAVSVLAGLRLKGGFSLAYAYDAGLSKLQSVHSGSHEVLLGYRFKAPGKGRPPRIIFNPRFL